MRCVFETQLKVDIASHDDKLRKAFIDLVTAKAREVFGVAGMLAKEPPVMEVSVISTNGKEKIPLFAGAAQDNDDDDGE